MKTQWLCLWIGLWIAPLGAAVAAPPRPLPPAQPACTDGGTTCPGQLSGADLDVHLNVIDAWAASLNIQVTTAEDFEDLEVSVITTGILHVGNIPDWTRNPIVPGVTLLPSPQAYLSTHLVPAERHTRYFWGIPVSVSESGMGQVLVSIATRPHGALPLSSERTLAAISDGRDLHVGDSLFRLREQLLEENLTEKKLSAEEIERRLNTLDRSGAYTSGKMKISK